MKNFETMDGNEAVAGIAFQLNEVVALFPSRRRLPRVNGQTPGQPIAV
jgi:hypothetical protein